MSEPVSMLLLLVVMLGVPAVFIAGFIATLYAGRTSVQILDLSTQVKQLRRKVAQLDEQVESLRKEPSLLPTEAVPPSLAPAAASAQLAVGQVTLIPIDEPATPDASNAPSEAVPPAPEQAAYLADPELADALGDPPPLRPAPMRLPSVEKVIVAIGASVGSLALLIGLVFGLVAVAERGFLGPAARVSGGLMVGTGLWVVGALLRGRMFVVPSGLAGAGMGTLYGAIFAASSFYGLIGPTTAFVALVAVSAVSAIRAVAENDRFMAYLGVFGGLFAPVAVSTGDNGAVGLFIYLFLLSSGLVWAGSRRRWPDLIVTLLLGSTGLYVGWTARWLAPDSLVVALVAAFALAVPYALGVVRTKGELAADQTTRVAAGLGTVVWMLVALPWLWPPDAVFYDPRTSLEVLQPVEGVREIGALAVALLALPAWMAARARGSAVGSLVASVLALFVSLTWTAGWEVSLDGPDALTVFVPLAPLVVGLLVHLGARRTGVGLGILLFGWAAALGVGVAAGLENTWLVGSTLAALGLVLVGSLTSSTGWMLLAGLLAAGVALLAQAAGRDDAGLWVLGTAALVLGTLPTLALGRRWTHDANPAVGWFPGVIAGVVLFPATYLAWQAALGLEVVGVLPILLGFHACLGVLVLTRVHRRPLEHPVVLLAVVLTLAGVTFALPIQFQEKALTIGWALEAVALAALTRRLDLSVLRFGSVALGIAVGIRLIANKWALEYGSTSGWPILNWTLYTWGVPTLCLVAAAWCLDRYHKDRDAGVGPRLLRLLAMGTGFALVNVQVSHAFQDAGPVELGGAGSLLEGMVRSLGWGGYGLSLLVLGFLVQSRSTRIAGFAFMMLAASKVFVYDLWAMPGFIRVGSLIGLGVTLIVSAVLFNRLVLGEPSQEGEQ